ncbi:sodium bile acid symporter family protein [Hypomontagnella monticulosa]|nr:sodium bile acid symporter family protein [Hypomontagnella monticulosa]
MMETNESQTSSTTTSIQQDEKKAKPGFGVKPLAAGVWWFAKDQWFIITLLVLILISSQVQVPQEQQQEKTTVVQNLAVAVIFFVNGCTIPTKILVQNIRRLHVHLFIQALCFLLTSSTALGIVTAAATNPSFMDPALLNGIVLLGCLPTALSFNTTLTKKAHGNDALTLTESALGSLLGPLVSTALIELYSSIDVWYAKTLPRSPAGYGAVFAQVFKQLGLTLFLPLFVGQIVLILLPKITKTVMSTYKASKLASFSLLILIWSAYDGAFETGSFSSLKPDNIVFIVFISVAMCLLWGLVGLFVSILWLSKEDSIAVAYCVSTKTPALGVPLTRLVFAGITQVNAAKMSIPMVIFQCIQTCIGSLASIAFRRWVDKKVDNPS